MTTFTSKHLISAICKAKNLEELQRMVGDSEQNNSHKTLQNTNFEWISFPYEYFKSKRFDCSKEHLLNELATRAEYWHKEIDGSYSLPKLGGQLSQILEMAIAAKLKD